MKKFHHQLIQLYNMHRKASFKEFARLGLTQGQPKVLEILLRNDGCAQKELAQACGLTPATMSSLVKKMEADGLIVRQNRRLEGTVHITEVRLTEKGRAFAQEIGSCVDAVEQQCFQDFSEEEQEVLADYLDRILRNLCHS